MGRKLRVTAVLLLGLLLLSSGVTWAMGPMIFSGDDADSTGHCQGTLCGSLYAKALKAVYDASTSGGTGILAIMTNTSSTARTALTGWNSTANGGPNATITYVSTAAQIAAVNFSLYRMIYVPSGSNLTTGGLTGGTGSQLAALNLRKTAIQTFVNNGGGVLALSEQGLTGAFGWLPVPLTFATITDSNVQPTPDMFVELPTTGSVINPVTDGNMDHSTYHNSWSGTFGDLKVLAITKRPAPAVNVPVIVGRITPVNSAPTNILLSNNTIAENAGANAVVGTLSGTDPDAGQSATLVFSLPALDDNAAFNINGTSLRANASFNFETKSSYLVTVRATDSGTLTFDKQFTISVTNANEAPTNISLTNNTIAENAGANAVVGTLSGTDPDAGQSATLAFSLPAGVDDNAGFNISGTSLRANASFDFETKSSYLVTVRATDSGTLTFDKQFTISVTNANEAPTNISLTNNTIAENAGANAVVGTLSGTDPDAGQSATLAFSLPAGVDDNAGFNISGTSLRANASFDFETKSSYLVTVRATDSGTLTFDKQFTISVTNANEAPTNISLTNNTIAENAGANAVVGTLSGTDPDAGQSATLAFSLPAGVDDNAGFNISGTSLRANASFDLETKSSYLVTVRATDSGTLTFDKQFSITVTDVNEAPTNILLSNNIIAENAGADAVVGTLSGTDPDAGQSATLAFSLPAGVDDNAAFNISGTSLRANASFDFETKSSYLVTVRATDTGTPGLTFDKQFSITVTNTTELAVDLAGGFNFPFGVAVDNFNGDVYIADRNNHVVKKLSGGGGSPTVVAGCAIDSSVSPPVCGASTPAGTGDAGYNGDGGAATAAQLNSPTGVAVDASGNLFIADSQNHIIRKVASGTGIITTVAGTPETFGAAVNGGPATSATLFGPRGVAVDGSGNIYIADTMNQQIRKVDVVGTGNIVAVAGVAGETGNNDGLVAEAKLNSPLGVAVYTDLDSKIFVFIADEGNDNIRMVSEGQVSTLLNLGIVEGPSGVAVDADGNIYIADTNHHRIVRVSGESYETVDNVAGSTDGTPGSTDNKLNTPVGVAVKADGSVLYIADLINNRIEKVDF